MQELVLGFKGIKGIIMMQFLHGSNGLLMQRVASELIGTVSPLRVGRVELSLCIFISGHQWFSEIGKGHKFISKWHPFCGQNRGIRASSILPSHYFE